MHQSLMSRKKKDYHIMVKQPYKEEKIWGCNNPLVRAGHMCCDGDCSMCEYKTVETLKVYK